MLPKEIIILLFITTIGLFLRLYNNFDQGYWADEILTLIFAIHQYLTS